MEFGLCFETRGSGPPVVIPNGVIYLDDLEPSPKATR